MKRRGEHIEPYVLAVEPWYQCEDAKCNQAANWRVNTSGIDGEGIDFCTSHVKEHLQASGNQHLTSIFVEQSRRKGLID